MNGIIARARAAGFELPPPPSPNARYLPWKSSRGLLYLSGQVSDDRQGGVCGVVGGNLTLEQGVLAARASALRLIANIAAALDDDLSRLVQVVKINGYVQAAEGFAQIPQVIDGCSSTLVEVFGDIGMHARSSVGVYRLPRDFAVEVEAVVEIAER